MPTNSTRRSREFFAKTVRLLLMTVFCDMETATFLFGHLGAERRFLLSAAKDKESCLNPVKANPTLCTAKANGTCSLPSLLSSRLLMSRKAFSVLTSALHESLPIVKGNLLAAHRFAT